MKVKAVGTYQVKSDKGEYKTAADGPFELDDATARKLIANGLVESAGAGKAEAGSKNKAVTSAETSNKGGLVVHRKPAKSTRKVLGAGGPASPKAPKA